MTMQATTGVAGGPGVSRRLVHFDPRGESWGYPTPRVFLRKSAESLEKKRVVFLMSAKMCKRVRKSVKGKEIGQKRWRVGGSRRCIRDAECAFEGWNVERTRRHPAVFVKADSKRVTGVTVCKWGIYKDLR